MSGEPNLLRVLVTERHWQTYQTFVRQYERAANELAARDNDPGLRGLSIERRQFERWLSGAVKTKPRPDHCRVLEHLFGHPVDELLAPAESRRRLASRMERPGGSNEDGPEPDPVISKASQAGLGGPAGRIERELAWTAHESSEHAGFVASHNLAPASLDQLHDDVVQLARKFARMPPLLVYDDAKRIRNLGFELLTRTRRTDQEHDLYLVIGQACGLLATVSFDLGNQEAATEQTRAAWIYGAHIGHTSLCTWARGMEALIAYWSDRPRDSVRLAREAQQYSPPGTALVRVLCIEARAWSHLGNGGAAARAIGAAHDAWDHSDRRDELHDEVGGEFSFDAARQAFCNGSAYVQLGAAESALRETGRALELYRAMPVDQRWPKVEAEAHTDLGAAYLLKSEFDGAREALFPVFALPPEQRVQGLTQRLRRVHSLLLQSPYRRSREALQLSEQIDDFTTNAPGRMLPSSQPPGLRPP